MNLQGTASLEKGKTGMMRHEQLRKQSSGFPLLWRLLSAFVVGLLLGLPVIFRAGDPSNFLSVFILSSPFLPLLGVLGRLAAARTKRPFESGSWLGCLAWFGIWLVVLLWVILVPETVSSCFPDVCFEKKSFWDIEFWWVGLVLLGVYLAWGLLLVLAGVAVTHFVLKRIASTPTSSR